MSNADILGWIGNVGFLISSILITRKSYMGFVFSIAANLCYVGVGILSNLISLVICSIVLMVVSAYGIYNWRK